MKFTLFTIAALFLCSCTTTTAVLDYDEQQDFSIYKSYNYFPEMKTELNELDQKRLVAVADSLMIAKGFTKLEHPDLYINFKTQSHFEASNSSIGVGVGSGGGVNIGLGGAIPLGGPQKFLKITTDFVDVNRDELVWQVITERRFPENGIPADRESFFEKVVSKSLTHYPPKKKK